MRLLALPISLVLLIATHAPHVRLAAAQTSPTSGPSAASSVSSGNTTGSLAYYCSNRANLQSLLSSPSNQASANLGVTIPSNLSDSSSLQAIAQAAWQLIVTYQAPFYAKAVAGATANGTTSNRFSSASNHTSIPADGSVTPNVDTLYSSGWLDLSQGPQVLTVPDFGALNSRYWIVQFSDLYMNFFAAVGYSSNSSGSYLIVGRNAQRGATYGNYTADRVIYAPTDLVSVLARILAYNSSDQATAYNLGKGYNISAYNPGGNAYNASSKAAQLSAAAYSLGYAGYGPYGNAPGFLDGLSSNNPAAWFNLSQTLFNIDPPVNSSDVEGTPQETSLLTSFVQNTTNPSANTVSQYQVAAQIAKACVTADNSGYVTSTGWRYSPQAGYYTTPTGTQYLPRAQDVRYIPTPLPTSQVIYYQTNTDSTGATLDASSGNNYTITFQLPIPAKFWWSLIIYNASSLNLIDNPINRYSVSDRTQGLVFGNNNTTLTAYISSTAPANGTVAYSNWTPAPSNAPFFSILRIFGPQGAALNNQYAPPPFVKVPAGSGATTAG